MNQTDINSAKNYPSEEKDRFLIRMPDGMRKVIAEKAEKNQRSMNSEFVARLIKSLEEEESLDSLEISLTNNQANRYGIKESDNDYALKSSLTTEELKLLTYFRKLKASKKKALLELLK